MNEIQDLNLKRHYRIRYDFFVFLILRVQDAAVAVVVVAATVAAAIVVLILNTGCIVVGVKKVGTAQTERRIKQNPKP